MSLTEVLPNVQSLSRIDKINLVQILSDELHRDDHNLIESDKSYPIWSPDRAYGAAEVLLKALEEDKLRS